MGTRSDHTTSAMPRLRGPRDEADPLDALLRALDATARELVEGCVDVTLLLREGEHLCPPPGAPGARARVGEGVEGAAASLRAFVSDGAPRDPSLRRLGARAVSATPVIAEGEVVGVLRVASLRDDAFAGAAGDRLLAAVADLSPRLALLAERRKHARCARRADALAHLTRLAVDAPLEALLRDAVGVIGAALAAPYVTMMELRAPRAWVPRALLGWPPRNIGEVLETDTARYMATFTVDQGRTIVSDDLAEEDRFDATNVLMLISGRSAVCTPVPRSGGAPWGIAAVHALEPCAFSSDDVRFLERACAILGAAAGRSGAEDRLRAAEDEHAEALAAREDSLATVAHELRAPTAALASCLGLLRASAGPTEALDRAERHLAQLSALCDDLLDDASLHADGPSPPRLPVDLREVVDASLELVAPSLLARTQAVRYARPRAPAVVLGDAARLTQALANLLGNASKYSREGEDVSLRIDAEGADLLVRVRDDGDGIDPVELPRLFERFVRGPRASRAGARGVGLGLAIARRLARMHGGDIEARSEGEGRGSEFTLRLPRAEAAAGARVLLVDDDDDVREALRLFLRASGHDVRGTRDGAAALRALAEFDPAVVLLDLDLPDTDGFELSRRVRRLRPSLPVVAVSGRDPRSHDRADGEFSARLLKPVDLDRLCALIAELTSPLPGGAV